MFYYNSIKNATLGLMAVCGLSLMNANAQNGNGGSCFAEELISYNYTKCNDGSNILATRTIGSNALGQPQNSDANTSEANVNFASLGFRGEMTLKFGSPIKNGEGNDLKVFETTFGSPACGRYPERVKAFASQDGCNFVYIGEGCQDAEFDLGPLGWAQYIKLVDATPFEAFYGQLADGYDVDGIMCLNGFEENPVPTSLIAGSATQIIEYLPGSRQNGSPIHTSRTNPNNALGIPQNNNTVNFVSLGFGGQLILKFDFVIFDNPSANDLKVVETSYGNPACSKYPETAEFEGSLDGTNWIYLGELCQDGEIDITAAGMIQYLRITDRSKASKFSSSGDGYDVDGVVVINACDDNGPKRLMQDDITTPDETFATEVYPNPFSNELHVTVNGNSAEFVQIQMMNYLGQIIFTQTINTNRNSSLNHTMNMADLKSGVYFLSIESTEGKEVIKVVKR